MARPNGRFSDRRPWPSVGQRYGYLVVTSRGMNDRYGHQRFWCRCDCGKKKLVRGDYLQEGRVVSCGHTFRSEPLLRTVKGFKCVETGEIFATPAEALRFVGLPPADYFKLVHAASPLYPDATLGNDPLTGEPLHWERANALREVLPRLPRDHGNSKKIILINTLEVFRSLRDAALRYPQADMSAISRCCNYERRSAGKDENGEPLVWMWYEDWNKEFK